ncbi:MAG TPA: entericidin EcnAB [Hydrogenophaga sp.]|uniref:entericidin EcnAB n=1 Tax=Hydrogenophaga sp. TaxID=1904254 RepID=UPI002CD29662|nr:entericidin EcnAB [Hydrogenophaga sp.]HMN94575.1 entericidin EcnAB [Hydrogenophaga sp.]HMP10065.1 entericidin EcnAB [Hydrogenophaga sp.]
MKSIARTFAIVVFLSVLAACGNTWTGVKKDTKEAAQSTGRVIEKAGEAIQDKTR